MKLSVVAACVALVFMTSFATPQEPPRSSIEGAVMDAGTGAPIPDARVLLMGNPALATTTDRFGKYSFVGLGAGSYRIAVAAEAYARQEYGQRVLGGRQGQGTALNLASGQTLKDILIRLTPTGTVTGHVRNERGQPAVGVEVQLVSPVYGPTGERRLMIAGVGRSNDRGEYRMYWVTPGRYYVVTGSLDFPGGAYQSVESGGLGGSPNQFQGTGYGVAFYPGVSDPGAASFITVESGLETKLDLAVSQQLYRVRGRVVDGRTGRSPQNARVNLQGRRLLEGAAGSMIRTLPVYDPATGTFEVWDVPSGLYYLTANLQEPRAASVGTSRPTPIAISGSDVDGVILTMEPSVLIPGKVSIDGQPLSAQVLNTLRVLLNLSADSKRLTDTSFGGIGGFPTPNADGSFILSSVMPGEYRLSIFHPPNYYVKQASYSGNDVLNQPIVVSSSPGTLNIELSANVARITGTVVDSRQQPAPSIQVVLIPEKDRARTELYRTATTDTAGRFTLTGVAPGDYKVFAWELLEPYAYFDLKTLEPVEQRGTRVSVTESSAATVEVRMIPAP